MEFSFVVKMDLEQSYLSLCLRKTRTEGNAKRNNVCSEGRVTGGWRKPQNKEFHNVQCSPNIINDYVGHVQS